jgi:hypothetical protein
MEVVGYSGQTTENRGQMTRAKCSLFYVF